MWGPAHHSKSNAVHSQFFTIFTAFFSISPTTQLASRLRRWNSVYRAPSAN